MNVLTYLKDASTSQGIINKKTMFQYLQKKSLLFGIFYYKTMNKGNFSESIDSWNIIK